MKITDNKKNLYGEFKKLLFFAKEILLNEQGALKQKEEITLDQLVDLCGRLTKIENKIYFGMICDKLIEEMIDD